jgi:hypothetical protein
VCCGQVGTVTPQQNTKIPWEGIKIIGTPTTHTAAPQPTLYAHKEMDRMEDRAGPLPPKAVVAAASAPKKICKIQFGTLDTEVSCANFDVSIVSKHYGTQFV